MARRGDIALALLLLAPSAFAEEWKPVKELQGNKCVRPIGTTLYEWGSTFQWEAAPRGAPDDPAIYRSPTKAIGVWTEIWIHPDGRVETRRTTAATTVAAQWRAPDCKPALGVTERTFGAPPANGSFTDEDLRTLVGKHRAGVIYAWSPAMPLSISGIGEMRKAAGPLGLPVIGVLDPEADAAIAETEAKRNGLTTEDLRRVESLELLNRGVSVHYPAIVLFSGGKILSPRLPGHAVADDYRAWLERNLPATK